MRVAAHPVSAERQGREAAVHRQARCATDPGRIRAGYRCRDDRRLHGGRLPLPERQSARQAARQVQPGPAASGRHRA